MRIDSKKVMEMTAGDADAVWIAQVDDETTVEIYESDICEMIPLLEPIKAVFRRLDNRNAFRWCLVQIAEATDEELYEGEYSFDQMVRFSRFASTVMAPDHVTIDAAGDAYKMMTSRWHLQMKKLEGFGSKSAIEAFMKELNNTPYACDAFLIKAMERLCADQSQTFFPSAGDISAECRKIGLEILHALPAGHPSRVVYGALVDIQRAIQLKDKNWNFSLAHAYRVQMSSNDIEDFIMNLSL